MRSLSNTPKRSDAPPRPQRPEANDRPAANTRPQRSLRTSKSQEMLIRRISQKKKEPESPQQTPKPGGSHRRLHRSFSLPKFMHIAAEGDITKVLEEFDPKLNEKLRAAEKPKRVVDVDKDIEVHIMLFKVKADLLRITHCKHEIEMRLKWLMEHKEFIDDMDKLFAIMDKMTDTPKIHAMLEKLEKLQAEAYVLQEAEKEKLAKMNTELNQLVDSAPREPPASENKFQWPI